VPHDREPVTPTEVADLVEHPVIGEVVFRVPGDDLASEQERGCVERQLLRDGGAVEVADDDPEFAEALGGQPDRQRVEQPRGRLNEGLAQDEVFRRVAGQHHLGERDNVRAARHQIGIAGEVAHDGVDLRQRES
jgi:hypothetical protein